MQTFADLINTLPYARMATVADGPRILEISKDSSMQAGEMQIAFDRNPDFFAFLPSLGTTSLIFLLLNKDGSAHGYGSFSLRDYVINGKKVSLGYASDLRTLPTLDRATRVGWRKGYEEIMKSYHDLIEFKDSPGMITAVWDSNLAAQAALVQPKKDRGFIYHPCLAYTAYSIFGRLPKLFRKKIIGRKIREDERPLLEKLLFTNVQSQFYWDRTEFFRTLSTLKTSWENFIVLERDGKPVAFSLPVREDERRALKATALPRYLKIIGKLLPLFGRPAASLGDRIKVLYPFFFRSINENDEAENAVDFVEYYWNQLFKVPIAERFHMIQLILPKNDGVRGKLRQRGYLSSDVHAKLYQVMHSSSLDATIPSLKGIEIGLL